ncbi:MAG TPA: S-methyl-5-thioribose-1-phosphate isomerase [Nitrososphaeraceae archaeon]|jgi:methylthioribose-1-phosphate isomerase|nr:S-methyl-5-thioribose-1-phosphate isomerase [Nitrososphaeraceae archaeon]
MLHSKIHKDNGKIRKSSKDLLTVKWENNQVVMIDQTKLPGKLVYVRYKKYEDVARAIERLIVRGAPAIGVAAAFGMSLAANSSKAKTPKALLGELKLAYDRLRSTRPTAVNLAWALDQIMNEAASKNNVEDIKKSIILSSLNMAKEDITKNKKLGKNGADILRNDEVILTHCNAGSLATVTYGTALGVLRAANDMGKKIRVIATETRPVMQGSRLTAFELDHYGIDFSLISDTAVGHLMSKGIINRVIVGADRILKTGHVYNKIGTYQVAALAKRHDIPFYVAAPISTFDLTSNVSEVVIEERNKSELMKMGNKLLAPKGIKVFNPAFDVTPPELITGIITEKGILRPPYEESISKEI